MPEQQGKDMRLRILACRQVYSGRNQAGHEYTIYEVDAAKPDGTQIREKLRAFRALPIGQEIDVTVTPFNSTRHGRSFTLHQKGRVADGGGTAGLSELREKVDAYGEMIAKLVARVKALEERLGAPSGNGAPAVSRPPEEEALDASFGKDAPW